MHAGGLLAFARNRAELQNFEAVRHRQMCPVWNRGKPATTSLRGVRPTTHFRLFSTTTSMSVHPLDERRADATLTQLLTLVNVSASAPGKRKYALHHDEGDGGKKRVPLNRRGTAPASSDAAGGTQTNASADQTGDAEEDQQKNPAETPLPPSAAGPTFESCFSSTGLRFALSEQFPKPNEEAPLVWSGSSNNLAGGTTQSLLVPDLDSLHGEVPQEEEVRAQLLASLIPPGRQPSTEEYLRSYADLVDCTVTHVGRKKWRDAVASHVMQHIWSTRKLVTKNNETLARAAAEDTDEPEPDSDVVRDQGFTRPKVLILAPLRNAGLAWQEALAKHSRCTTIDSRTRFLNEFALPDGVEDKLLSPQVQAKYPAEHIATFAGNIDDNFKVGMKLTRKTFKLFSGWYESDVIMASPLGLRLLIDSGDSADFLSSIEMLVVDQTEVMAMQNWEHVKYILTRMNTIPQESHDTDFSRVKQWYLDDKSRLFRQTIVSAPYVLPEVLHVFNKGLVNLCGKRLLSRATTPAMKLVRSGIRQTFVRFECADPQREPELRFNAFTTKVRCPPPAIVSKLPHTQLLPCFFFFFHSFFPIFFGLP